MICCEAMMQRHDMIDTMRGLGLKGMAAAFDEAVTTGLQRKRTIMEILTDLLRAEATHRDAASIRYGDTPRRGDPDRQGRDPGGAAVAARPDRARRAWISAVRTLRRAVAVPPHQQAL